MCETPVDRSTQIQKHPKGKDGTPIELIANMFPLLVGIANCFHYDIEIKLAQDNSGSAPVAGLREKKMRRLAQKENRQVIEKLANEWTDVFGGRKYVFDGQKNIYTGEKLTITDGQQVSHQVVIELDGFLEKTYEVFIKFANNVNISLLDDFFDGKLKNAKFDDFQQVLQVLEITLGYIPQQSRIPIGRCLYSKTNQKAIGDNAVMALGHYQSVNITEVGPTFVVDRNATVFQSSIPLIQFIANIIGVKVNDLKRITIDRHLISNINRQISGLKIFTTHIRNRKRIDTIDSLSEEKANEYKFEKDNQMITVSKYFKDEYNIDLSFGDFPLLLMKGGSKCHFPVEVCNVCPEQPVPKRLITPNMTREIVRNSNSQKPIERFSFIEETTENVVKESQELLKAFGLKVDKKPIKLNARKLDSPKVEGSDRKVKEGVQLKDWCFINLSPKVEHVMNKAKEFVDQMIISSKSMGINITSIGTPFVMNGKCDDSKTVDLIFQKAKKICPNLQLIVFCISSNSNPDDMDFNDEDSDEEQVVEHSKDNIYNNIKYYGDIKHGIITQCINADHVLEIPRGYFNNFLLKINSKLEGKNVIISPHSRLPVMSKPVMIVGVDVTHPGSNPSGNDSRIISSVAAVVGSYDSNFLKYYASVRVQPQNKKEIVSEFDVMMKELLLQFHSLNGRYPQSIIIFRDGVSEGQFKQVMDNECKLLLKAFYELMPKYVPKVTVIIVAKRHQTRLITVNEEFDVKSGKPILNIPAGTVIDNTIVSPMNREFYLCSHKGMLVSNGLKCFLNFFKIHLNAIRLSGHESSDKICRSSR